MSDHFLYSPASFFMVRIPFLPIDEFFRQNEDPFSYYLKCESLKEAIAIASPSLHEALQKINEKKGKEKEQILSSLLKYILRMATRSTPFGLFAFVAQGNWGDQTSIHFDHQRVIKRARPDTEWIVSLINEICDRVESLEIFPLQSNSLLFQMGNRIILNYHRSKESAAMEKKVSINASPLVVKILSFSKQPIYMQEICDKVIEEMPHLEGLRVLEVIRKLVEQDILIFNLHPSLLTPSLFQDLLDKLSEAQKKESIPEWPKLNELSSKIALYNQQGVGKGENALGDIQSLMKEFSSTAKNLLQVDSSYPGEGLILNQNIREELQKTAELLSRFSFSKQNRLQSYCLKFIERYGHTKRIPLLELLSEEGLGVPEIYLDANPNFTPSDPQKKWNHWIKREWFKGQREIILTESLIDKIFGPCHKEKAPLSFDLFCEIFSSQEDQEEYLLKVSYMNFQGGSSFGRFIDMLGEDSLRDFYLQEEALEKNCLFAESSFLPDISRYGNVATYKNLRKHVIDFEGSQNAIPFEKIRVGIDGERFYLSIEGREEELIVKSGNVLNPNYAPFPLRFLWDVSSLRYNSMENFSIGELETFPYIPRVIFNRSILSPEQWRVNLDLINGEKKDSQEKLGEKFLQWAKKWNMPRYVFMTHGDNRILLDCESIHHLKEITSALRKNETVRLVEKIGQAKGEWVTSEKGTHAAEFVFPFIKNKKFHVPSLKISQQHYQNDPNRWKLPGSEWLFVKLYLPKESESKFLIQTLSPFAKSLQASGMIVDWFFIRFEDPKPHIRVRFKSSKDKILNQLIPALHDWSLCLLETHLIQDMCIGSYERELERYGGVEIIEQVEKFFCLDSYCSIELLGALHQKKFSIPNFTIAAVSLIDLLKEFGLNTNERQDLLKTSISDQSELKGFREIKNDLLKIVQAVEESQAIDEQTEILIHSFNQRKEALHFYLEKISDCTLHTQTVIRNSLLHMNCNRLMGNQIGLEKKARLYAFHTLKCLEHANFSFSSR